MVKDLELHSYFIWIRGFISCKSTKNLVC